MAFYIHQLDSLDFGRWIDNYTHYFAKMRQHDLRQGRSCSIPLCITARSKTFSHRQKSVNTSKSQLNIISTCTLSYCHHQIWSMTHLPLFRVISWNNMVCAVCLSIFLYYVWPASKACKSLPTTSGDPRAHCGDPQFSVCCSITHYCRDDMIATLTKKPPGDSFINRN